MQLSKAAKKLLLIPLRRALIVMRPKRFGILAEEIKQDLELFRLRRVQSLMHRALDLALLLDQRQRRSDGSVRIALRHRRVSRPTYSLCGL